MRPIIDYHGPLFQWLCRLAMRIGSERTLLIWHTGVVVWLLLLIWLAGTKRASGLFTGVALVGVMLLRLPGLGLVEQNVDESQWIASAATLVQSPRFWQSVDGTTSGPLNVWPPALLYYLGLSLDYTTLRLLGLLSCTIPTVWLLLATFRQAFGERTARLAILPVATCLALTTDADGIAFNSEQFPMMLLALSGYFLSRIFAPKNAGQSTSLVWLLALGVVLGCLPYTKLQATPTGLVLASWVLAGLLTGTANTDRINRQRMIGFIVSGLLPTVLVGLYLLATGLTDYAFRSYILTNLEYAQAGSWDAGTVSWADRIGVRLPQIYGSMPTTGWFWCLAIFLLLLWLGRQLLQPIRMAQSRIQFRVIVSVCLVTVYATLQPGNPFAHYQWLSFVPVSWLIGFLINALISDGRSVVVVTTEHKPLENWWTRGVLLVYLLIGAVYPVWLALSRPNNGITQLAAGGISSSVRAVSRAIQQYASPNETMVVWGWTNNLHVETGLLMGTRFIPLYFPVVPGPQQAYFLDVYRQDLLTNRPAILVDAVALHAGRGFDAYPIHRYPAIQAIVDADYRLVRSVAGAKIYVLQK